MNEWYETRMWITSTVSARADRKRFLNFSVLHNVSKEISGLHFLDRMSGYDLQPLHQRPVLFRRDLQSLFFGTGPAEAAQLQPFVKKKESVRFLSEYSDKNRYPQPFVIRIFLPFILRYARFPGKNMRIKIILARRCGQVHLHHPAIPDLRIQ